MLNARPGSKIKYAAWDRPTVLPDGRLTPQAIYTIARVHRWQHGTLVCLREMGKYSRFNSLLFTPVAYIRKNND